MSTIKELAETCGVSEQAIRKWCARNQVAKDVAQRYIRPYDRIEYDQMVLFRTTVWYYKTRPFGLTALTYNV